MALGTRYRRIGRTEDLTIQIRLQMLHNGISYEECKKFSPKGKSVEELKAILTKLRSKSK